MQTAKRRLESGVIGRLLDEPYRFEFFQAVRVLLIWLRRHGVPHEIALTQVLRFQNSLSLGFPASEIEALSVEAGAPVTNAAALQAALDQGRLKHVRLTPAFIGFLGVNGALPFHYSERIASHFQREKDDGARAFLDTFSNRMVALFFRAWGKYRVEYGLDVVGKDGFLTMLTALAGIDGRRFSGLKGDKRGGVAVDAGAYYAGLVRQRPVSAAALKQVLTGYFGVPVAVEQCVGGWDDFDGNRLCKLGGTNAVLGYKGALGVRCWRRDLRVRLRVGPLDSARYARFLPGGDGARQIGHLLALFGVPVVRYEVQLLLKAAAIVPATLAGGVKAGRRLGWDAFLMTGPALTDRPGVRYAVAPSLAFSILS